MAGKELQCSIAIGGYMASNFGALISSASKIIKSLGFDGSETAKKLEAIGKINAIKLNMKQ